MGHRDGAMQDPGCELPRTHLPRTLVNKGPEPSELRSFSTGVIPAQFRLASPPLSYYLSFTMMGKFTASAAAKNGFQ
jgi:hypothetical protein